MEQWDLYDSNRRALNKTYNKGTPFKAGEYHVVVGICVINSDDNILFTLRSDTKEQYPNMWENTYGSVLAGESSVEGAVRELYEETGIRVDEDMLDFCGTVVGPRSFVDMYILNYDIPISKLKMQEGETSDAMWVSRRKYKQMVKQGIVSPLVIKRLRFIENDLKRHMQSQF